MCWQDVLKEYIPEQPEADRYKGEKLDLISTVAFLIGVPENIFDNEHMPPQRNIYDSLRLNKSARIVRNLCMLRTAIERNFGRINKEMKTGTIGLLSLPEFVPQNAINELEADGVNAIKSNTGRLAQHIVELNRLISDRINNCRSVFPDWIKWEYIKDIFIMPNGLKEEGTKVAAGEYFENMEFYPYQCYINWPASDKGNILYNDRKFAHLLYEWNNDYFAHENQVSDVGDHVRGNIYDFIDTAGKVIVVVDCENSDPYRLSAAFAGLDKQYIEKISRVLLFDDVHTTTMWNIFDNHFPVPEIVEHMTVDRIKEEKSLVDHTLIARATKEHYKNDVDSFIIVSSDSDYWSLMDSLDDAHFLVMVEHEKCGPDIKDAMEQAEIYYCYIDDFYSGNSEEIRTEALLKALKETVNAGVPANVNRLMDDILEQTRVSLSATERIRFIEKYLQTMKLEIDKSGNISIVIKGK